MKRTTDTGHPVRRRRLPRRPALVALLCAAAACGPAPAACRIEQMTLPVQIVDRRPITTVRLNGTDVKMLVDSGAFHSFLNTTTAEQLGLALDWMPPGFVVQGYGSSSVRVRRAVVRKVGIQQAELSRVEFLVDHQEIGSGIGGILGANILAAGDTEYDLAQGVVRLAFPKGDCDDANLAYWAAGAPVATARLERGRAGTERLVQVDVAVNGQPTLALLDTGAADTALALKVARRAGIVQADLVPGGRIVGGARGGRSWTAAFRTFELGGEKITNGRLRVDDVEDDPHGLVVGMDYFLSHRIYVARSQRRVYLTWNGDPVFPDETMVGAPMDTRDAARPRDIADDDADGLARRGAAALARGDHERARADLDRAVALKPAAVDILYLRALVHLDQKDWAPGLADLDAVLQRDPAHAEARLRRAWTRLARQDRAGTLEDLVQLDQSLPASAHQRAEMGDMHAMLGDRLQALRQYALWIRAHPDDPRTPYIVQAQCRIHARLKDRPPDPPKGC